ncbi:MAG: hypothetical protein EPO32_05325 [Anaerolineae bacterium]|nr:MAG: hypothetical protein EPO32_05325 [Anaerolineae bacterium]
MNRALHPAAFLPAAIFLMLIGYGGLVWLVLNTLPTLWPRWLMFFLMVCAVCGTLLPVSAFLNFRFPSQPPPHIGVVVRQSLLGGIYVAALVWLWRGQVLTGNVALVFLAGLVAIEVMIRLWERSRWRAEK